MQLPRLPGQMPYGNERNHETCINGTKLKAHSHLSAFTLVELSIVLVIIGLIVGGILVGQSLIGAAQVRAQITQIERYNQAVNTFRTKYNALPGDLSAKTATLFGFTPRGPYIGQGDGNGLIEGAWGLRISGGRRNGHVLGRFDNREWAEY